MAIERKYKKGDKFVIQTNGASWSLKSDITGREEILYNFKENIFAQCAEDYLDSIPHLDEAYIRENFPDLLEAVRKEGYKQGFRDAMEA